MLSKITKTEPLKPVTGSKKQFFDINRKKLSCFIKKEKRTVGLKQGDSHQNPPQLKPKEDTNYRKQEEGKKERQGDSPDIARRIVNDIIGKIQTHGLEFQQSDDQDGETLRGKSLSPTGHEFSSNNIWKKDWTTHSISKSFYSSSENSSRNFKNQLYKQIPSTHRSSNTSFSNYQQSMYGAELYTSFYYQQPVVHNSFQIVFQKILEDGPTTMMIKNIPNKYSLSTLGDQIDATHMGQYDFLYLPFDYSNKCNMGYAFINFLSQQSLKTFYEAYNLRRWLKYKSQKICELTYARLQGRASLVDHFHSSKVSQKGKNYRPIFRDFTQIKELIAKQKSNSSNQTYVTTLF